jgi:N-acetylmuramoyl-L-alanine amidase
MADTPIHIPELKDKFVDYRKPIWGNSYTWSWERRTDEIRYVVIHHSVTTHDATADDIALLHKARGWGGIGYHFVITMDGKAWYVGDVSTARANVLNMNEKVIGICMVGDFTQHLPTDEQIVSCHTLSKFFLEQPNWPNLKDWDDVVGHKDLKPTACPGLSWPDDMKWRVETGTPYTPPSPEEIVDEAVKEGKEKTMDVYKEFQENLVAIMRLPSDKQEFAHIEGKAQELMGIAGGIEKERKEHQRFVNDVAKGIGCPEATEKGVRNHLVALEDRIKEIRTKRLEEFGALERILSGLAHVIKRIRNMRRG